MKDMSIIVAGASGLVGQSLCEALGRRGAHVFGLTRNPQKLGSPNFTPVPWSPSLEPGKQEEAPVYVQAMSQANAVVNIAGHSIGEGRFT